MAQLVYTEKVLSSNLRSVIGPVIVLLNNLVIALFNSMLGCYSGAALVGRVHRSELIPDRIMVLQHAVNVPWRKPYVGSNPTLGVRINKIC